MEATEKLKYEGLFKTGDIIRAYDFEPTPDREPVYLEGVVLDDDHELEGVKTYKVMVTKDVYCGKEMPEDKGTRKGKTCYVPFEVFMFEYEGRITKI